MCLHGVLQVRTVLRSDISGIPDISVVPERHKLWAGRPLIL